MNLTTRDRRALILLAGLTAVFLAIRFWPESGDGEVAAQMTAPQAERRVRRLRQLSESVVGREEVRKKVAEELAKREQGLIQADTAAQAQAAMLQVVRRVLKAQTPPVDLRTTEMAQPRPFGDDYGEVSATLTIECGIEQIINLLADLGNQPEAISTSDLVFSAANPKQKTVPVRLVVTALVPRKLVPAKKEGL